MNQQNPLFISKSNSNLNQTKSNLSLQSNLIPDALLFQNLRDQAQSLGLDSQSLGWNIIQSIHTAQSIGKGSSTTFISLIEPFLNLDHSINLLLLLPKVKILDDYQLTRETFLHHILLTTPSPPQNVYLQSEESFQDHYLCNLNGWKGLMKSDHLVFTSPGKPISNHQINEIDSRFILSKVKPSTSISNELISPSQFRFPIYNLLSPPSQTITIPRLNSNVSSRGNAAQRLASLFSSKSESEPLKIYVRVCDRELDSLQLDRSISSALLSRITDGLGSLEEDVLQIVQSFIARFSVYYNPSTVESDSNSYTQAGSLHLASNEEIAQAIQEMYSKVDHQLEQEYQEEIGASANEDEKRLIIDHTLELIEEVVSLELYDRFFEEDVQDEQLNEKIAQLNLLDITLDHLGLDLERREMDDPDTINTIRSGLDDVIKAASIELSRLQDGQCRSPRDQIGVYVTVHKLIVDGLSSLPPIPMRKEGIPTSLSSKQPSQGEGASHEVEMSHTINHEAIVIDKNAMDRTLPMPPSLRPVKPDQPSESDLLDAIHTNLMDSPPVPSSTDNQNLGEQNPKRLVSKASNLPRPNSSSADLILPILIYLIIKTNPNRLESNLNYVNRFRYQRLIKGETDYCLVNFSVSCEFIKKFQGLDGSNPVRMGTIATHQMIRPGERSSDESKNLTPREIGRNTIYGTFTSSNKSNREKNANMNEVEDAFIAASRAVGGALMEGYQKVISSSLLDSPAAKLGLAPRSGPRTLEDVKKLIGSGTAGRSSERNISWSDRVGLLRNNLTNNDQSNNITPLQGAGSNNTLNGSSAVKRISSLFQNNNSSTPIAHRVSSFDPLSQTEDDRVTISQRLSSLSGLGKQTHHKSPLTSKFTKEIPGDDFIPTESQTNENSILVHSIDTPSLLLPSEGPIERFERCSNSDNLLMSDVPILLADYQRLCKIGRNSGLWT